MSCILVSSCITSSVEKEGIMFHIIKLANATYL